MTARWVDGGWAKKKLELPGRAAKPELNNERKEEDTNTVGNTISKVSTGKKNDTRSVSEMKM